MNGFLFDQNLPARLTFVPSLSLIHATALGQSPSDSQIWLYAKTHDLVIVTKDADFSGRIILTQPPPRVVHLRFGNLRRADFHSRLAAVWPQILRLLPEHKLINVYTDRIEAVT